MEENWSVSRGCYQTITQGNSTSRIHLSYMDARYIQSKPQITQFIIDMLAGKEESLLNMLRSILAQMEYSYRVRYYDEQGVPFKTHLYVPEDHSETGLGFCWSKLLFSFLRPLYGVCGFTQETLHALIANIEGRNWRQKFIKENGLPVDHPRSSTTDDVECFFSILRDIVGPNFTLKTVQQTWRKQK